MIRLLRIIVGLASILDGVIIVITLGSVIPTLRQQASLNVARAHMRKNS